MRSNLIWAFQSPLLLFVLFSVEMPLNATIIFRCSFRKSQMIRKKVFRHIGVIVAALAIPIIPFVIIGELPGDRWLNAVDNNAWLFGLTGGALLTIDILLPIPSSIVGTFLGARLGFWIGLLFTWSGLVAGSLIGFSITRFAFARFESLLPTFPRATTDAIVFLSRPVPVFAEAVALAAGTTPMPLMRFFCLSAVGNAIYAAVLCGNGATLIPDKLMGPGLIIPMALPVLAWLVWRTFEKKQDTQE